MKPVEMLSSKEISMIEFREKLFMEEVEKYVAVITGERESILPYIRDENGIYSEKMAWEFIGELTKCAHIYWEYQKEKDRREYENEKYPVSEIEALAGASDAFSAEEEEYLQSFLYCVIRIVDANPWRNTLKVTQTFQDFIWFANEHYEEAGRLYAAEATAEACGNHYENLKGIYRPADWLTHLFTGTYLSDRYSDWEQEEYFGYLSPALRRELEEFNCKPSRLRDEISSGLDSDEIDRMCAQYEEDYLADLSEEERAAYAVRVARKTEKERKAEEEKERIKAQFAEKEQFVRRYLTFKEYRYAPEYEEACAMDEDDLSKMYIVQNLDVIVKGMVRLFTESRGLSRIQDDKAYFTATALLKQSNKRFWKLEKEQTRRDEYV
ncbi:MAG: hypothetical protein SO016_13105 [Lachnospiraceae bacterium]|nr:hypothetical protein [Robinsoniella sp.]MDY3767602.1 hypothetical protein [Lachnospiraceae bacterium]